MSNVDSCVKVAIVPEDKEKPLIGPFILANGDSEDRVFDMAHEQGLEDGTFDVRQIIYPEDLINEAE